MRISLTMAKQLTENQIGVAFGVHEARASQRIIADQLGGSRATVSRLFNKISITAFKTRGPRRIYKASITDRTSCSVPNCGTVRCGGLGRTDHISPIDQKYESALNSLSEKVISTLIHFHRLPSSVIIPESRRSSSKSKGPSKEILKNSSAIQTDQKVSTDL